MGHDVIAVGNHKLNTRSLHTTAVDLSEVFDATVRYGYVDDWIDLKTGKEGSFEFVEEGRIEMNEAVFTLVDTLYMDRLHDGKYINDIDYDFYGTEDRRVDINIFRDFFYTRIHFNSRWWNFVKFFQGEFDGDEGWFNYISEYRRSVWAQVKLLGGNMALYGDDQGESHYILDSASELSFTTLLQKIREDFGDECLDVSSFMREHQKEEFKIIRYKAFVDDFEDLK